MRMSPLTGPVPPSCAWAPPAGPSAARAPAARAASGASLGCRLIVLPSSWSGGVVIRLLRRETRTVPRRARPFIRMILLNHRKYDDKPGHLYSPVTYLTTLTRISERSRQRPAHRRGAL